MNDNMFNVRIPRRWYHNIIAIGIINYIFFIIASLVVIFLGQIIPLAEPYATAIYTLIMSFGLVILLYALLRRYGDKLPAVTMGLQSSMPLRHYIVGFILGAVYFTVIMIIVVLLGGMRIGFNVDFSVGTLGGVLLLLLGFTIQGSAEEVAMRGYILQVVAKRNGLWFGIIANSILFAILHGTNSGITVIPVINLFLFGLFASLMTVYYGNILPVCGFHVAWNWFQGSFYGILVSGQRLPGGSVLVSKVVQGKDYISGGDFGIEGSLVCTAVLIIGIVYYYIMANRCNRI